jgi:hypothetical protein
MFKPGSKVQVIDEIGRWEMARILQVFPDMPDAMVRSWISSRIVLYYNSSIQLVLQGAIFRMGDDIDKLVGEEEIRLPLKVHPLGGCPWPAANTHTQITSRGRGKGNGLQSEYLILIRLLVEQTGITGDYF